MKISRAWLPLVLLVSFALAAQTQSATCPETGVAYEVSLKDHSEHMVHVAMHYKSTNAARDFQLPVWNALYQVRDFSQYVSNVLVTDEADQTEPALKIDKTTWRVEGDGGCDVLNYDVFANNAGPFDAQLNDDHAFFNWAQVLMYPVNEKAAWMTVRLKDIPEGWVVRDGGVFGGYDPAKESERVAMARNYDALVDAPIEIGKFEQVDFSDGGANYHVVIHATAGDVKPQEIAETVHKIVRAEVEWMRDRPFTDYTFLYHMPRGPAGGGMEHANSTAIDVTAARLTDSPISFASVTAHEFFHLWNVKRIRPQSLEPIDYTKEQYTRALWFSEGVTSTVSEWILVRAGLLDERGFLDRLARQMTELDRRPAAKVQSVEESSLDAWLEKYPYYNSPGRSINYYNKGEIVGALLDLEMREHSKGKKCLRELFQYMNANYAKQGKFFADSHGVETSAEAVAGGDFGKFFEKYVAGTAEIPYNDFFKAVGLQVIRAETKSGGNTVVTMMLTDLPQVTPAMRARRAAWIRGEAEGETAK